MDTALILQEVVDGHYFLSKSCLSRVLSRQLSLFDPKRRIGGGKLEEVIVCSGCRPVVLERFPMKAWTDGTPGFNPDDTSEGDRKVREVNGDNKIYQRVNPLVPRKEYACEHQLRDISAMCVEQCAMECKPDGFNYKVSASIIILLSFLFTRMSRLFSFSNFEPKKSSYF